MNGINGIIKQAAFLIIAFLLMPLALHAAQQEYYTIIAGTYRLQTNAENDYISLQKSIPDAAFLRIEKNSKFYTVRIGRSLEKSGVERFLPQVRRQFKDARLLKVFYKPARIIKMSGSVEGNSAASALAPKDKAKALKAVLPLAAAINNRHEILPRHLKKQVQSETVSISPALTAALAGKQFFSIQLASFANEHRAHKEINNLRGLRFPLPWLRVERVQRFFTVRAGRFNTRQQVRGFMKQHGAGIQGRIMAVYIRPERIVELYEVLNSG
ncbi:hypothetical protein MNBD_DELTA03-663, partial [hydrothermal vent metagenome]